MSSPQSKIHITSLDAAQEAHWDQYVDAHPLGSLYHLSAWRRLIADVFGHESHYLFAHRDDGEIVGVLPMVQLKSRLFGNYLVSMPYFNYGGVLASDDEAQAALLDAAAARAQQLGARHLETRDAQPLNNGWPARSNKVVMCLGLPTNPEPLWQAIGPKIRAQVKRPDREDVTITHGGLDQVDAFYDVFARNMRDLGTPVYSKAFFETICRTFLNRCHLVVVNIQGNPAAAGFLLGYKDRLEIPWASSLREWNRVGANMRLYWEGLKYAIEAGYRVFDFGRSTRDSGTYRFKKQWGAEPVACHWHYWLSSRADMPQLNPDNPKFKLAVQVWQRLPLAVTNTLGPHIVRNLP